MLWAARASTRLSHRGILVTAPVFDGYMNCTNKFRSTIEDLERAKVIFADGPISVVDVEEWWLTGFLATLGLILWPFLGSLGLLYVTTNWGGLGFVLFMTGSVGLAYYLNKARKHGLAEKYDDRLTNVRMDEAREWLVEDALQTRAESE